ncbi:hypothetical protein BOH72_23420 [Mycobacterium sp. WY10]|nr:hypothetical protein BOH72_23420 [Mycobacterium sp. WY10]
MDGFEINEAGMAQLQQELEQHFSGGLQVPLGGSEEDAIRSVKEQLEALGATPDHAEVERMVRETRETHGG